MRDPGFTFEAATTTDVRELVALHTSVAAELTRRHGHGPWSCTTSERGMLFALRTTRVFVARRCAEILATFRLTRKKPWAINTRYFTPTQNPIYLLAMAVPPENQGKGIGRACLEEAERLVRASPGDAIRLDAFDAEAGAGGFYARCGYTEVGRVSYRNTPLIYYERLLERKTH